MQRRFMLLQTMQRDPTARAIEKEMCRRDPHHWFNNWVWTFDPRLASQGKPAHIPFDMFPRQHEMVDFLAERLDHREDGLIEKSRDIGFTWVAGGFALHQWMFQPGFKTTFGSRKAELVDKRGEPDSIFEKLRYMLRYMPNWLYPEGFNWKVHDNYMRLINPANDNTVAGEAGDDIGRGGRSSMVIIDEAAFIEHGDSVDAATSGNSDCRIWASTVNTMGDIFARKRFGGSLDPHQIFRFHYTDDPRKTPEWAAKKRKTMEDHKWASEYDIDYNASTEGICIPSKWVMAGLEIRDMVQWEPAVRGVLGLDVGAGGKAKSVAIMRLGPVVTVPHSTGNPDTSETAHWALDTAVGYKHTCADSYESKITRLCYDSPGVGAGVMSVFKHNRKTGLRVEPINTGNPPSTRVWPDKETSVEKFGNLKAEIWWVARARFKATFEHVKFLKGEEGGIGHPISDLIILPAMSESPEVQQLVSQLSLPRWFRNDKGKIVIESKASLSSRGIASPDHADALVLTFVEPTSKAEMWAKLGQK